jgi:PilZ domain-containing protein
MFFHGVQRAFQPGGLCHNLHGSEKMSGDEFPARRRFPRIASHHAVLAKNLAGVEEFGHTKTIAVGGCSFVADESLGVGSPLELLITVDGHVVSARARVVYEHDEADGRKEIGVEFASVDDASAI